MVSVVEQRKLNYTLCYKINKMKLDIIHYRYERSYGFSEYIENKSIVLNSYKTLRETTGGYWIEINRHQEKFVLKKSNKRFAYPTKEEAWNSFRIRTKKSLAYAKRDVNNAKDFLELIEKQEQITLNTLSERKN